MYSYFFHLSAYKRSIDPEWEVLGGIKLDRISSDAPRALPPLSVEPQNG